MVRRLFGVLRLTGPGDGSKNIASKKMLAALSEWDAHLKAHCHMQIPLMLTPANGAPTLCYLESYDNATSKYRVSIRSPENQASVVYKHVPVHGLRPYNPFKR